MKKVAYLCILFIVNFNFLQANTAEEKTKQINMAMYELIENEKEIQHIKGVELNVNKNLQDLKNIQIAMNTKNISILDSSIISLDFHHMHFTKLYFPIGTKVIEVKTSTEFLDKEMFSNRVELRPKDDLIQASVSISFIYNNKNYDITIIANKYDVSKKSNTIDNIFYPKIRFVVDKKLTPEEVLKRYRDSKDGKFPPDNSVTNFQIGNKIYTIEKDDFENTTKKPNLFVLHPIDKINKYRITLGEVYEQQ